jgi:hypothetical protein
MPAAIRFCPPAASVLTPARGGFLLPRPVTRPAFVLIAGLACRLKIRWLVDEVWSLRGGDDFVGCCCDLRADALVSKLALAAVALQDAGDHALFPSALACGLAAGLCVGV